MKHEFIRDSCSGEASSHLSGLNIAASAPNTLLFWWATQVFTPTVVYLQVSIEIVKQMEGSRLTPAGKNFPLIVAPPSGTSRTKGRPVAGCILKPSLMHACRYGMD